MNTNEKTLSEKFQEIDYFTQRQIINEFPSFFPEYHTPNTIDTIIIDPFHKKPFDLNEFYGAFLLVIGIIVIIGQFLS